ncbi:MAG: hypothetical protein F6K42_09985 [Leptolyngbya sp. SIO1D8]|nr:hypothetical protein [Leptolyngbya sp. SIO1D8]
MQIRDAPDLLAMRKACWPANLGRKQYRFFTNRLSFISELPLDKVQHFPIAHYLSMTAKIAIQPFSENSICHQKSLNEDIEIYLNHGWKGLEQECRKLTIW